MTVEHDDRVRRNFVTNSAARASTSNFRRHGLLSTINSQGSTRFATSLYRRSLAP
jgi:hypothetical protein